MTEATTEIVRVEDWLELMPELADELHREPAEVQLEIAKRILSATSADEVLADDELSSARELVGRSLELRSVKFNRSAFHQGGPPVYAVVESIDESTGELVTWTCGAVNVLMQLLALIRLGQVNGRSVRIKESRPNEAGNTVLRLVRVSP